MSDTGTRAGHVPDPDPPRRPLVVMIDDDDRVLALGGLALSKHDITVLSATDAAAGLALIDRYRPDLVILDVVMPDMSGWELLRRIRASGEVPVFMLSGRDSDVDKARGLDLGADDYLTKPFSFLEFEARVRALLRRSARSAPVPGDGGLA